MPLGTVDSKIKSLFNRVLVVVDIVVGGVDIFVVIAVVDIVFVYIVLDVVDGIDIVVVDSVHDIVVDIVVSVYHNCGIFDRGKILL